MLPDHSPATRLSDDWKDAQAELARARQALALARVGLAQQTPYKRLIAAQRRCTNLIHGWFAESLQVERVINPHLVLSLDVDGVLEEENEGFSATGLPGAAALRLLQIGGVAVVLNTARSPLDVQDRVEQFRLLGGVSGFGSVSCDAVFGRDRCLVTERAAGQLRELRAVLRAKSDLVVDATYCETVRASRVLDGQVAGIPGSEARVLLDEQRLHDITYWVAPRHTDFVDRGVNKQSGLAQLLEDLGLRDLSVAAMGDASCDVPMLRKAKFAFLPAATLPSYTAPRGQRLCRSRFLGERALWEAAGQLVPSAAARKSVLATVDRLEFPHWFPAALRGRPPGGSGILPRLGAALGAVRNLR
jgi:hypothetical protein